MFFLQLLIAAAASVKVSLFVGDEGTGFTAGSIGAGLSSKVDSNLFRLNWNGDDVAFGTASRSPSWLSGVLNSTTATSFPVGMGATNDGELSFLFARLAASGTAFIEVQMPLPSPLVVDEPVSVIGDVFTNVLPDLVGSGSGTLWSVGVCTGAKNTGCNSDTLMAVRETFINSTSTTVDRKAKWSTVDILTVRTTVFARPGHTHLFLRLTGSGGNRADVFGFDGVSFDLNQCTPGASLCQCNAGACTDKDYSCVAGFCQLSCAGPNAGTPGCPCLANQECASGSACQPGAGAAGGRPDGVCTLGGCELGTLGCSCNGFTCKNGNMIGTCKNPYGLCQDAGCGASKPELFCQNRCKIDETVAKCECLQNGTLSVECAASNATTKASAVVPGSAASAIGVPLAAICAVVLTAPFF
jgi:hypothetical protein